MIADAKPNKPAIATSNLAVKPLTGSSISIQRGIDPRRAHHIPEYPPEGHQEASAPWAPAEVSLRYSGRAL